MNGDVVSLILVLLLIAVVGLAVAATVGVVKGGLPQPATDVPPPLDGPVAAPTDLDHARFQLAFRGYRMDQVDRVLDDARDALAARDAEIAHLRTLLPDGVDGTAPAAPVLHSSGDGDGDRAEPAGPGGAEVVR